MIESVIKYQQQQQQVLVYVFKYFMERVIQTWRRLDYAKMKVLTVQIAYGKIQKSQLRVCILMFF